MANLPGLNYDSKLSIDDFSYEQQVLEDAILSRTSLVFGGRSLAVPQYGIADSVDPRNLVSSETSRPLLVYQSSTNALEVNITPGTVVTPNGAIVTLRDAIQDFTLVRTLANDIVVVFLENRIVDSPPVRVTVYNVPEYVRRSQMVEVQSVLLSDFINPVLFPPNRLANVVVMAVITVVNTVGGLALQFDYSNASYTFNRPWYSPVDVQHRSYLGSGSSTANNPHALSFNDLTSGPLTLYEQVLPIGLIQSRNDDIKGVPGTICKETIAPSRILTDSSGAVTSALRFGGIGAKYVILTRYPVWVHDCFLSAHMGNAISFDWIPGTRTVVFQSVEEFPSELTIEYNSVYALEPPAAILSNTLTLAQPVSTREIIYTGGLSLTSLTNASLPFDGSGAIPRNYKVYVNGDGTLLRSPQLIQTTILLEPIGTNLIPISAAIFGAAHISVGLAYANPASTMKVVIRIYGKDSNGSPISEDLTFLGTTWTSVPLPGVETPTQYIVSSQVFSAVTNIQVISRTDDGPNSQVVMWAELESGTTFGLDGLALAAGVVWDGRAISSIQDLRKVVKNIPEEFSRYQSVGETLGTGGTSMSFVLSEDFRMPKYREVAKGSDVATNATFSIFIDDYTLIQPGDTVVFPNGATLSAIIAGVPNRTIGQYKASVSNNATALDMITTINTIAFNSGATAIINSLVNQEVDCTITVPGARGNGPVTQPVIGNPSSVTISGDAEGGIDSYGENFLSFHSDGINVALPSGGTYDVTSVRNRYRSRAIPIANRNRITVYIHGAQPPFNNLQMRARMAVGSSPVWLPWQVIAGDGIIFTFTSASVIRKIQLDFFGQCQGYTVLEGDI